MATNDWEEAAFAGQAARPILHEINNFLNDVMLSFAIAEAKSPEALLSALPELKRKSRDLAGLILQWQRLRRRDHGGQRADMRALLQQTLADWPIDDLVVEAPSCPLYVQGSEVCVKSILHFTFAFLFQSPPTPWRAARVTLASQGNYGRMTIATQPRGDQFPASSTEIATSSQSLPFATAEVLIGHVHGSVRLENTALGGIALTIEIPSA